MTPASPGQGDFPLWLVIVAAGGLWALGAALTSDIHVQILATLWKGLGITLLVTVCAFAGATVLGLGLALAALSRVWLIRQLARLYVEVMRGVPILVLLLYVAFVGVPLAVEGWNALGLPQASARDVPLIWRAVLALVLAYASFLAEVFRAGILAVPAGQVEAAGALGLSRFQRFRLIVAPQAFRTILPPWGNDFIAIVKDSSLVSVLGVTDVTQLGKVLAAGNFRYFETYNMVALIYLGLTISLSVALRRLELRLRRVAP
ncbi:amino acid ABC transporter permease [Gemmobacter sp.]|uniref:amino acid ABC transporter permease n=1 Tax=Gemmobacter sp. TaxID=1898957 RepID=UPI002AFE3DC5|nr:amino acid ABC transporter permease [Gemmobacter sp.]